MINRLFVLLLTIFVAELYFMSFGQNPIFGIPMMKSVYEINVKDLVKISSIVTGAGSLLFLYFGLRYTGNFFWGSLLTSITFASCLLGWKYVFGLHSEGTWGYSILLSVIFTIIVFFGGVEKANIYMDPVSELPE